MEERRGRTTGIPIRRPSSRPSASPVTLRLASSSISRARLRVEADAQVASLESGLEMTSTRVSVPSPHALHRSRLTKHGPRIIHVPRQYPDTIQRIRIRDDAVPTPSSGHSTTDQRRKDVPTDHAVARFQAYDTAVRSRETDRAACICPEGAILHEGRG